MELDDFKQAWQAQATAPPAETLDAPRIRELLRRRSHSALARLRRNILLEAVLSALMILPVFSVLDHYHSALMRVLVALTVVFCLTIATVLGLYYRRLGTGPDPALPLPEQLRQTVHLTEGYVRTYERSMTALTVIGFTLGGAIGGVMGATKAATEPAAPSGPVWPALLFSVALLCGAYFLTVWLYRFWIRHLYGRHLDDLRACLAELEE